MGIVLDDGQESAQRRIKLLVGGDFAGRRIGGKQRGAGPGDIAEDGLFLFRDTFDGFHQVGNEIGAALQHDINLSPGGPHSFVLDHRLIANGNVVAEDEQCH